MGNCTERIREDDGDGFDISVGDVNLEDIIRTRKVERKLKAEQKRLADLQSINTTPNAGINPLEIFPKTVWLQIFDELSPEDRQKVRQLHPVFSELMKGLLVRDTLLPLLLKVPAFQKHVGKYISAKELRLISRSTRDYFDKCADEMLVKRIRGEVRYSAFFVHCNNSLSYNGTFDDDIERMLLIFGNDQNSAKRVVPRGLHISVSDRDLGLVGVQDPKHIRDQKINALTTLLELIGDKIWYFKVYICELASAPFLLSEVYLLLYKWVLLVPNIRWLKLFIHGGGYATEAEKVQVRTIAASNPYPRLEFLETITISLMFDRMFEKKEIFQSLITANQHVNSLIFRITDDFELQRLPAELIKSLPLTNIYVDGKTVYQPSLGCIQSIVNFDWALKSISLDLDMSGGSLNNLFNILNGFPTLEKLTLRELHNLEIKDANIIGYLNLPNLTSFRVDINNRHAKKYSKNSHVDHFFSLHFLLPCKNLETLQWFIYGVDYVRLRKQQIKYERNVNKIDFRAGLRNVYQSKLWDVFPSLNAVTVHVECWRNQWERQFDGCTQVYHRNHREMTSKEFLLSHLCTSMPTRRFCVVKKMI